ncbi:MAG: alpha/beta fold hydrolase [Deltaproteobacteria bacterium]|nr:alpha/beta fold hydrolase [Deltaproteobacteria bacterium]
MPYVEREGARLYYETHGDGPPLVLAHGAGGNTLVWWQQVPVFARRHRVLTFDHRGFGRSTCAAEAAQARHFAADLTAILDHASIARAALICQSMGGWTGLQLALAAPPRVAALVLSGTPAGVVTPKVLEALTAIASAAAAALQAPAWNTPHPALAADIFERDPERGFLYAQLAALNPEGGLARLALHEVMTDPTRLADWTIPTLLVGGTHDRLFAPDVLREVAAAIPAARFREIPYAGHSPYFETPEEFNLVVGEFLAGIG